MTRHGREAGGGGAEGATRSRLVRAARPRRVGGFTLLEVMVALGILLAGVVGILGLFASGLAMHRNATRNTIVAQASEDVRMRVRRFVEDAVAANAGAPELDPLVRVEIPGHPGYFYDSTFEVDDELGPDGGVMATVHVYTLDAGRERGQTFTLFTRPQAGPEAWIRGAKKP
ncbi:MAG: prepilin-type N-terminal cleavage/methylation domain-containing protein [Planctomycetota bacterium JB042]